MKKHVNVKNMIASQIENLKQNQKKGYDYYRNRLKDTYEEQIMHGEAISLFRNRTFILNEEKYYFIKFSTWDFGDTSALSKRDYAVVQDCFINYCTFTNCNLKNIIFRNCSFFGSKFENVVFDYVTFDNCVFSIPLIGDGLNGTCNTYYVPTLFKKCTFVADFSNCDLENALFEQVNFTFTKFQRTSLQHSIMTTCAINGTEIKDCILKDFSIIETDILDISFSDERLTTVDENTFIDYQIKTKRETTGKKNASGWIVSNYDEMCLNNSKSIRGFAKLFFENGYADYEGEYYYRAKNNELQGLHGIDKIKSYISFALCGYGERPSFTLGTIVFSIFVFGLIYMFSGIDADGEIIKYTFGGYTPMVELLCDYGKCLFFSVTTFSTVGYGNYIPLGTLSMIVSAIHMIIGVSLCALWTGCIFRKIAR